MVGSREVDDVILLAAVSTTAMSFPMMEDNRMMHQLTFLILFVSILFFAIRFFVFEVFFVFFSAPLGIYHGIFDGFTFFRIRFLLSFFSFRHVCVLFSFTAFGFFILRPFSFYSFFL